MRAAALVAVAAVLALAVAACGASASPTPEPSPTPTPVCAALDDLQASIDAIDQVDPLNDGLDGYVTALQTVRTDLTGVREAAGGQLSTQIDAVETAVSDLQGTLDSLGDGSLGGAMQEIGDRLSALGTVLTELRTATEASFSECKAS